MKRRQPGPPSGRQFDPRFPGRGGPGRPPPNNRDMGRGPPPPPGRFQGRGGPGPRPSCRQGSGPPQPHPMGRGPSGRGPARMPGRGPGPMHGQMGRGRMPQRPPNGFGRGNMMAGGSVPPPGRPPASMGRNPPMPPGAMSNIPPPPPPRGAPPGAPHPGRQAMHHAPPQYMHSHHRPPSNIPPPPMQPPYPHQPQPMAPPPLTRLPPPSMQKQRRSIASASPSTHSLLQGQSHALIPGHGGAAPSSTSAYSTYTTTGALTTVQPSPTNGGRTPVPTQKQIDDAWAEYTAKNGVTYYHNPLLKQSTYTKPDALVKKDPSNASSVRQWQEFEDPATGKKYYSNGATTQWEKPPGFRSLSDAAKEENAESPPKKKKKKKAFSEDLSYSSKEEAIAAFKGLLLAKGIAPAQKWNEVAKYCSSDDRWESFDQVLSVGDRRQALAEYQTKRANELKNQERQERIRAKEAFGQLLTDVLQTVSGFSAVNSRFSDIRSVLAKDDRFYAVADEETRESIFLEFCEELRKRDERKKRNKKREAHDSYTSFLSEKEEAGTLTFASTWDSFFSSLTDEDREDSRFKISPQLSDSDRQLLFADFVIELQAAEDDKRRRIRDARRRAEKAQREAYRDVLRRLAVDGLIRPYTQWRSVEDVIAVNDAFNPIQAQDRDAPREIFEEFVEEWVDVYRRERAFLSRLVNSPENDNAIKPETSHDDFAKLLLRMAESSSQDILVDTRRIINRDEPVSAARIYLEELLSMAKDSSQRKGTQRRAVQDESSEDEGEIIEEGEADVNDMPETGNDKKDGYIRNEQSPADVANTAGIATIDSTSNAIDGTAGGNESNGEPSGAGLDTSDS